MAEDKINSAKSSGNQTRLFGIFGCPATHSLSPAMHNAAFRALGMRCVYLPFNVSPEEINRAVASIRALGICGINVTVPHKRAVMRKLDFVSPEAEIAGAVNTIKNDGGKLLGFNTDIEGALKALRNSMNFSPKGKTALIIGAGGAGRALILGLATKNSKRIFIANKTPAKAKKLSREFSKHFAKTEFESSAINGGKFEDFIKNSDIIINCSSAGMEGSPPLGLPLEKFRGRFGIYDLVYNPAVTPLVKKARRLGIKAESGISMLLYQGARSFEIWTGEKAPIETMKKALKIRGK